MEVLSIMKTCIVCEDVIEDCVTIRQVHICVSCEENMVQTVTHEQKYAYYMKKLKKLTPVYF